MERIADNRRKMSQIVERNATLTRPRLSIILDKTAQDRKQSGNGEEKESGGSCARQSRQGEVRRCVLQAFRRTRRQAKGQSVGTGRTRRHLPPSRLVAPPPLDRKAQRPSAQGEILYSEQKAKRKAS